MLKAIELAGFKSFADRTRLEFGDGITAIVGPNGSGKSNIVDAIKWVLGEQSMKKLRSSESSDVIFGGSIDRQPLGSASVTLTFDNSKKIFDLDTPEVHITRRVYRSGEGEYLINRQASRLKDIKDLLAGTGLGLQAYSIIEQGRVESLLQHSAVQRRVLFDEAAGISRFNARKQEIQRRHERVDQNLLRLADKVKEVEQRLKQSRSQAGKAQLYQQYKERLQTLRIQAGLEEYRQHHHRSQTLQKEIEELRQSDQSLVSIMGKHEESLAGLHTEIETIEEDIRQVDRNLATIKQQIAGEETSLESQAGHVAELHLEMVQHGQQRIDWINKNAAVEEQIQKLTEEQKHFQRQTSDASEAYQNMLEQESLLAQQCKEQEQAGQSLYEEMEANNRQHVHVTGTISVLESQRAAMETAKTNDVAKLEKLGKQNTDWARKRDELQETVEQLQESLQQRSAQLEHVKKQKNRRQKQLTELNKQLSELKQKQSGMNERISLLNELIRKHEGISPGVRDVLEQSSDPKSPFRHVWGLVADLFRVEIESASLIELALGSNAQHVVVSPKAELFRHINRHADQFAGRVGFIWLDPSEKEYVWMRDADYSGHSGVLGRADQFVQVEKKFAHLARRLLGRTWIVQDIDIAKKLYQESDDRTNFLTVSGEMLTPDGALIVGPHNTAAGLMTRRSEWRDLSESIALLNKETSQMELAAAIAQEHCIGGEIEVEEETREHQKTVTEYESKKLKLSTAEEQYRQGLEQYHHLESEIAKRTEYIAQKEDELKQAAAQREQLNEQRSILEIKQIESKQQLEDSEKTYNEHQEKVTNAKVELAKNENRRESQQERIRQLEEQYKERQSMLSEHQRSSLRQKERRDHMLLSMLGIESLLAELYVQKETQMHRSAVMDARQHETKYQRTKQQADLKRVQLELQKDQSKIHAKQLELERCVQMQNQVIHRLQEDYGIDMTSAATWLDGRRQTADGSKGERPEGDGSKETIAESNPQKEIEDLRSKLNQLGNVNLEAMETLEDLENQYKAYSTHYHDIVSAKKFIEKEIERLNTESRQIFSVTFEEVRTHFQGLFQKLFGGGSADLILDNPDNMLESGVEIIAKPPGKELKNVMLLSGGEKTLTCFALLLAFFKYKPNPVCVLDECDAALDEGNVDRYNGMLKEFGSDVQFLMITHNKKSMAFASTMYGITMQEKGVSKSVSVRYVDVGEDGEILDREKRKAA